MSAPATRAIDDQAPVIVGVGQVLHRPTELAAAVEPVDMMLEACRLAGADTTVPSVLGQVQSVCTIRGMWNYENPARFIAAAIGADAAENVGTLIGGNYVQVVVNHTAAAIQDGKLDVALITGAENGYSAGKARKAGVQLPARATPGSYDRLFGAGQMREHHDYEMALGIRQAIEVYPMYENALRHARGESLSAHMARVSALWARFSAVAAGNPHAWLRDAVSAETIATPSASNRRISFPYTKLMNANMMVDMGAALLLCSARKARALGIPRDRWIYPHAGVEGRDHFSASVRDDFVSSPGIRLVGRRMLELAEMTAADLQHVDLYSCFPSAVQIAARELGLAESRPLTVTGGLTFGGGPINNYVMHAIARMVEVLRLSPGARGLVTANGGNLYKHAHAVYGSEPPARGFRHDDVQAAIDALPARPCLPRFEGDVSVESYTVMYAGDGPSRGHFACRTPDGSRVWANTQEADLMQAMTEQEFCGAAARIDASGRIRLR